VKVAKTMIFANPEWKDTIHEVILTAEGYEHQGQKYKSFSAIACAITGAHRGCHR
jgi:hypothetical protein